MFQAKSANAEIVSVRKSYNAQAQIVFVCFQVPNIPGIRSHTCWVEHATNLAARPDSHRESESPGHSSLGEQTASEPLGSESPSGFHSQAQTSNQFQ